MAKAKTVKSTELANIEKLKELAEKVGCADNPLFVTALDQYIVQLQVINLMREELSKGDLAVSKEYVKGRENLYAHPLIKELPKHADSATKSATFLWNMIRDFGALKNNGDSFDDFLNEIDGTL